MNSKQEQAKLREEYRAIQAKRWNNDERMTNYFKPFEWKDLHGKTLEIHYGYLHGHYCVIGVDKETDIMYLLASGREE